MPTLIKPKRSVANKANKRYIHKRRLKVPWKNKTTPLVRVFGRQKKPVFGGARLDDWFFFIPDDAYLVDEFWCLKSFFLELGEVLADSWRVHFSFRSGILPSHMKFHGSFAGRSTSNRSDWKHHSDDHGFRTETSTETPGLVSCWTELGNYLNSFELPSLKLTAKAPENGGPLGKGSSYWKPPFSGASC